MIPVLVCLSGMFAGLTLGCVSLSTNRLSCVATRLRYHRNTTLMTPDTSPSTRRSSASSPSPAVLPNSTTPAASCLSGTPLLQPPLTDSKDSHLLLTTLILGNMIVNESLPVVADAVLGGGLYAVIISTVLVVVFAEIIPQSVCARYGLRVGAGMAPVVRVLIWIVLPLAWPIAKLLEWILGAHQGVVYRSDELRELINIHAWGEGGGDLDEDTVKVTRGALDLGQKTARDVMTPMEEVFMLPIDARLDYETLDRILRSGHSRIPVYQSADVPVHAPRLDTDAGLRQVKTLLGYMLVKDCVLLDPADATPLSSLPINPLPSIPWDEPLTSVLHILQGGSRMAIVSRRARPEPNPAQCPTAATKGGLR